MTDDIMTEEHIPLNLGRTERWLSGLGGAALIRAGLGRASLGGLAMTAGGAVLMFRALTGHSALYRRFGLNTADLYQSRHIEVRGAITIARPVDEVYHLWRQLDSLPQCTRHIQSVSARHDGNSHWVAREGLLRFEWDARIIEDVQNKRISWRSLPSSRLYTEGDINMSEAPGERGTEVRVRFCVAPPAGIAGLAMSALLTRILGIQLSQELHRIKQFIETGEVATSAIHRNTTWRARLQQKYGLKAGPAWARGKPTPAAEPTAASADEQRFMNINEEVHS